MCVANQVTKQKQEAVMDKFKKLQATFLFSDSEEDSEKAKRFAAKDSGDANQVEDLAEESVVGDRICMLCMSSADEPSNPLGMLTRYQVHTYMHIYICWLLIYILGVFLYIHMYFGMYCLVLSVLQLARSSTNE